MPQPTIAYWTPKEAAGHLRVAPQTLARWRCEGNGPAYILMGRRIVYRPEDLDTWVAGRRVMAAAQRPAEEPVPCRPEARSTSQRLAAPIRRVAPRTR
jgi:hypothetical protein